MQTYQALRITETPHEGFKQEIEKLPLSALPEHDTLVRVAYSSLNFKDALSAHGNKGVSRNFPHTPGIDAVGQIEATSSNDLEVGDWVIVTGFDLGMNTYGGLAEYIRVPEGWVVPLPENLSPLEAMTYGTAGLTAAMCIDKLLKNGLQPTDGPVVVTGASGGVGSLAVWLLANLGFSVVAVSGKETASDMLKQLGAEKVIGRDEVTDETDRPLLKGMYAAAVDTVGGVILATLLKSLKHNGAIACCGLVNSPNLRTTVFPFILRGNTLFGVDSAEAPMAWRTELWQRLATTWKPANLATIATVIDLAETPEYLARLLHGNQVGRVVVKMPTS